MNVNEIMSNGPHDVWRVEINYLSHDYDDSMLSTSTPYKNRAEAEAAYTDACGLLCVDDKKAPARVTLEVTHFPGGREYGKTEIVKRNY